MPGSVTMDPFSPLVSSRGVFRARSCKSIKSQSHKLKEFDNKPPRRKITVDDILGEKTLGKFNSAQSSQSDFSNAKRTIDKYVTINHVQKAQV